MKFFALLLLISQFFWPVFWPVVWAQAPGIPGTAPVPAPAQPVAAAPTPAPTPVPTPFVPKLNVGVGLSPISDVDFKRLGEAPQFTWGANAFFRRPGFAAIDPETDSVTPDKFKLDGIIFDPEEPLAIINDRTVGVGELFDGVEIMTIQQNYVVLKGSGLHFELALPPSREPATTAEITPSESPKESLTGKSKAKEKKP